MLEHADRDDTIEPARNGAIIDQFEFTAFRKPGLGRTRARNRNLFVRQRHAGDTCTGVARQIERHAAPATADIEYRKIFAIQIELGRDMPLLGDLRFFKGCRRIGEIGTGILPVLVQEHVIEPARQIIMMMHMGTCPRRRIELRKAAYQPAPTPGQKKHYRTGIALRQIGHQQVEQGGDITLLHRQAAIHVKLAQFQVRPQREFEHRTIVMQFDRHFRRATAIGPSRIVGKDHSQLTVPNHRVEEIAQHDRPPISLFCTAARILTRTSGRPQALMPYRSYLDLTYCIYCIYFQTRKPETRGISYCHPISANRPVFRWISGAQTHRHKSPAKSRRCALHRCREWDA